MPNAKHNPLTFAKRLLPGALLLLSLPCAHAQQLAAPQTPLTLDAAIDFGLAHYPAVRAFLERTEAAKEAVALSRTIYLPRADLLWQSNRATRNNIFGQLLPQSVVASISGPVLPTTSDRGAWGSAAGALISWEPFDFGYREATVGVAKAGQNRANAELSLTKLDVAVFVGQGFLAVAAAQEQVRAAQADVDRRQVLANSVRVLVQQQLRPGADASRADAELAAARIQLIRSQEIERDARSSFAEILGIAGTAVEIDATSLTSKTPEPYTSGSQMSTHPLAQVSNASIFEVRAREKVLSKSFYPRFNLQGAVSGRGSGTNPDGTFGTGTDGLGLERRNWAVGMTTTFSILDFASLHFKKQIEQLNERAQQADYEKTLQNLTAQSERAKAAYDGAILVAQNTPVQLQAAQLSESQARARYQAGLASIVEVADGQRLLLQAETEDNLARLGVWRAMLGQALAQGDLEPFLASVRTAEGGK
jgi:outer membrane protein